MANVKGGKLSSKLAFVRTEYGSEAGSRVVSSMSPDDQAQLKIILDTGWYPLELYDRLVVAICQVAASGDETVYSKMGRHSAEHALTTTYKAFRGKDPADLLKKSVHMHSLRNEPAKMDVACDEKYHCVVKIEQPRSTLAICKITRAFYVGAIELCGGQGVQVSEPSCSAKGDGFCLYDIAWR